MTHGLNVVDPAPDVSEERSVALTSASNIATGLSHVLSDTYSLLIKTHVYHWNVTGPSFYAIHNLTEEHYQNLFAATDELAERIRALGHYTPFGFEGVARSKAIGEPTQNPSAKEMVGELASDHDRLARRLVALNRIADDGNDPVTADMATERVAFHQKAAWMLRSMIKES